MGIAPRRMHRSRTPTLKMKSPYGCVYRSRAQSCFIKIKQLRKECAGKKNLFLSGPALEGGDGLLLIVIDFENRHQFGDLQHIAQALAEPRQFDIGTG